MRAQDVLRGSGYRGLQGFRGLGFRGLGFKGSCKGSPRCPLSTLGGVDGFGFPSDPVLSLVITVVSIQICPLGVVV